jgi:calcineurin-like phosphoesterase family protein
VIFYTSDTHFFHDNILKFSNRAFPSTEDMNEELVKRWNAKVDRKDTVIHLGDVLFGGDDNLPILKRLNGNKQLILGNHDQRRPIKNWEKYFGSVHDIRVIFDPVIDKRIALLHYPMESWPYKYHNAIHLHGHCHGMLERTMVGRMDVGIDCHPNLEPWSSEEIMHHLLTRDGQLTNVSIPP